MKNLYKSSILIIGTQKYIIVIWFPIVRGKKFKNQIIKKLRKWCNNYQSQTLLGIIIKIK